MSPRRQVSSGSPYEPVVGYSRAVRVGDMVFVSGCAPIAPDGNSNSKLTVVTPDVGTRFRIESAINASHPPPLFVLDDFEQNQPKAPDGDLQIAPHAAAVLLPLFEALDVTPLLRLRPRPLRTTRFVLDGHLGTLARYLRILGFDTLYRNDFDDAELAHISHDEKRVLLTRDVGLLKRSLVTRGLFLRATDPRHQLVEVVSRLDLYRAIRPFRRCARCNALVRPVARKSLEGRVKPAVLGRFRRFHQCSGCGQIYWPGSHYDRMLAMIDALRATATPPA